MTHWMDEGRWQATAKNIIRVEMMKRDMTYGDLSRALNEVGLDENERNLRNKIARGTFSASFLLQCLAAMDAYTINFHDLVSAFRPSK